jgi:hypothetical protein
MFALARRWRWSAFVAVAALAAVAAGGAGHASAAAGGVVFGGLSSQDRPIVVVVSPRRTRVSRVLWDWETRTCEPGPARTADTPPTKRASDRTDPQRFPISRLGRWSGSYTAGPFPEGATGVTEMYSYKLTGRFLDRGTRMAGTIRVTYTETAATGALIRTCRTGRITYDIKD